MVLQGIICKCSRLKLVGISRFKGSVFVDGFHLTLSLFPVPPSFLLIKAAEQPELWAVPGTGIDSALGTAPTKWAWERSAASLWKCDWKTLVHDVENNPAHRLCIDRKTLTDSRPIRSEWVPVREIAAASYSHIQPEQFYHGRENTFQVTGSIMYLDYLESMFSLFSFSHFLCYFIIIIYFCSIISKFTGNGNKVILMSL